MPIVSILQPQVAHLRHNELRDVFTWCNVPSEASWMFYIVQVLLRVVGFEGDDAQDIVPSPLERAKSQADFLFRRCSESYLVCSAVLSDPGLDYPEYDVHRVILHYFPKRRDPSSYSMILMKPSLPVSFVPADHPNFWSDTSRVLQASLIALARTKTRTAPVVDRDGKVTHIDPRSIDSVFAEMVSLFRPISRPLMQEKEAGYAALPEPVVELLRGYLLKKMSFRPLLLRREPYSVVEAHAIIVRYSLQALFLDKDNTALMMQRVVHPSIYLLSSRLRYSNEWVDAKSLNITERVLLCDSVRCIVDVLRHLINSGAEPPSIDQISEGVGESCHRLSIRYASYLGLSDLLLIVELYCPSNSNEQWLSHSLAKVRSALDIAKSWNVLEVEPEFLGFEEGSLRDLMSEPEPFPIDNPCFFYVDEDSGYSCAAYVERVCGALCSLQISDADFVLGAEWVPPMPIARIMERVVRPSVFVLQKLLDPWFDGSSNLPFAFSDRMHGLVQHALRKVLQLIKPDYPSYIDIWTRGRHKVVLDEEPPVSGRAVKMFDILIDLVDSFGFPDCATEAGVGGQYDSSLFFLRRVSRCWKELLGTRGEYDEYSMSGQMLRKPAITGCKRKALANLVASLSRCKFAAYHTNRLKRSFVPALPGVPWSPSPHSLFSVLEAEIRSAVLVVQDAVDPKYSLSDFVELSQVDYRALSVALDNVMVMLYSVFCWLERRSLSVTLEHPFASELLFPEEAVNMLRILRVIILHVGYDSRPNSLSLVETLSDDARSTHSLLQGATEFPAFKSSGELMVPDRFP
ncbi:hypothetical protein C8R45DRAFT_943183 [Mycena sanguinolenta]|nr:hypothetical protein C8R45DRAFT_943183 [Mycena sanguinolenta]